MLLILDENKYKDTILLTLKQDVRKAWKKNIQARCKD
jgi:hypothetical protein